MRLFVAADIDDDTRSRLTNVRAAVQSVVSKARVPPRVTWVKDESAHITVRFIGETPDGTANTIRERLATDFSMPAFEVAWQRVGTFPSGHRPRVIWLGAAAVTGLAALADLVNARLEPIIGRGDARPFTAHLTLGRVKEPGRGVDWAQALAAVRWTPTTTRVDHVVLYASRTLPDGPTYTPLLRTPLA